jgi:hypothetical protein
LNVRLPSTLSFTQITDLVPFSTATGVVRTTSICTGKSASESLAIFYHSVVFYLDVVFALSVVYHGVSFHCLDR